MAARLCQDNDTVVRETVAAYGTCDPQMVTLWADDPDPKIRGGLARNRSCPQKLLQRLARDADWHVRADAGA